MQKASESVERKQKVVFVFAASSGAARYVMAPGNKLHDFISARRTRIITFNKELYVCLRDFMGFPGVLPRHSRWDYKSESLSRGRQRSQRTTLVPDQDDVVPTECVGYVDIRVLSPRRRRAVGLLSGLRVLSCLWLFCLVTSALSAPCPLKDHVALASLSFINAMEVPSCVV